MVQVESGHPEHNSAKFKSARREFSQGQVDQSTVKPESSQAKKVQVKTGDPVGSSARDKSLSRQFR